MHAKYYCIVGAARSLKVAASQTNTLCVHRERETGRKKKERDKCLRRGGQRNAEPYPWGPGSAAGMPPTFLCLLRRELRVVICDRIFLPLSTLRKNKTEITQQPLLLTGDEKMSRRTGAAAGGNFLVDRCRCV